jgi:broad specificity phosphatase PhoE
MSRPAAVTRVLLVRHGQSTWNADGRWQGQADPPLSPLGERQATEAAMRTDRFDAIWSSDLVRAHQTAEIVAARLGLDVRLEPRLRERDAGEWQGHTRAEIEEQWPGHLASGRRPPGYEDDGALLARTLAAMDEIEDAHPRESVLVVAHGGIVRILERHLGDDLDGLLPNLGGRWVERDPDHDPRGVWRLGQRALLLHDVAVTTPQQL